MDILRSPFARIFLMLVVIGTMVVSIMFIAQAVTKTWNDIQTEGALFKRSPNCQPHTDPSEVDQSLPPCQEVMASVTAKPEYTTSNYLRHGNYPKTHRLLILQYSNGGTQTVGDIYADMWQSIRVGDTVSATFWRGKVVSVAANGFSSPIDDPEEFGNFKRTCYGWGTVLIVCFVVFSLLLGFHRRALIPFPSMT